VFGFLVWQYGTQNHTNARNAGLKLSQKIRLGYHRCKACRSIIFFHLHAPLNNSTIILPHWVLVPFLSQHGLEQYQSNLPLSKVTSFPDPVCHPFFAL
jgi:hypothetical protein